MSYCGCVSNLVQGPSLSCWGWSLWWWSCCWYAGKLHGLKLCVGCGRFGLPFLMCHSVITGWSCRCLTHLHIVVLFHCCGHIASFGGFYLLLYLVLIWNSLYFSEGFSACLEEITRLPASFSLFLDSFWLYLLMNLNLSWRQIWKCNRRKPEPEPQTGTGKKKFVHKKIVCLWGITKKKVCLKKYAEKKVCRWEKRIAPPQSSTGPPLKNRAMYKRWSSSMYKCT